MHECNVQRSAAKIATVVLCIPVDWTVSACSCACIRDYDADKQTWGWARAPPVSQRPAGGEGDEGAQGPKKLRRKASEHERALREFTCALCAHVLRLPLSTPCGHHFCKPCLEGLFQVPRPRPLRSVLPAPQSSPDVQ